MSAWVNWQDGWPDWEDGGRRIEVEYADGSRASGVLTIKDVDYDDPLFVVMDGETEHPFADCERYRFLT